MKRIPFATISGKKSFTYAAERPKFTAEKEMEQFTKDGTRYYRATDGRLFDADLYDLNFNVKKLTILPKHGKVKTQSGFAHAEKNKKGSSFIKRNIE